MAEYYDVDRITNDQTGDVFHLRDYSLDKAVSSPAPIVSFPDGSPYPMSLTAAIDPVQDLHGYDHPWPGGGGKNLLPMTVDEIKAANIYGTWNENTYSIWGVSFTLLTDDGNNITGIRVNGTSTNDSCEIIIPISGLTNGESYVASGGSSSGSTNTYYINIPDGGSNATSFNFVYDSSLMPFYRIKCKNGSVVSNVMFYPMIRLATVSDATFAPYSNVCPITGFTQQNVTVTGKNLLPVPVAETKDGITLTRNADGSVKLTGTASTNVYFDFFAGNFDTTFFNGFRFVATGSVQANGISCRISEANRVSLQTVNIVSGASSLVITDNGKNLYFAIRIHEGAVIPEGGLTIYPMIVTPSETDFTFVPYQSAVYPITFPSSAGTVYGGTVTVNPDGTGELVVDRADVDLGSLTYGYNSYGNRFYSNGIKTAIKHPASDSTVANIICSTLKAVSLDSLIASTGDGLIAIGGTGIVSIRYKASGTDATAFKTAMSGAQLVYELATPITYSLNPGQVLALLGQTTNVWADTGYIQSLSYVRNTVPEMIRQDTVGQIGSVLRAIIAPVLDGMVADTALSVNDFRIVDGTLYKVTAPIASGGTLTVGTNVAKTTIGEQITALLNA